MRIADLQRFVFLDTERDTKRSMGGVGGVNGMARGVEFVPGS